MQYSSKYKISKNYPLCTDYEISLFVESMWDDVENLYSLTDSACNVVYSTLNGVRKHMSEELMSHKCKYYLMINAAKSHAYYKYI